MQTAIEQGQGGFKPDLISDAPIAASSAVSNYKVIRRGGEVVGFEPAKVSIAMTKAFLAVSGGRGAASARTRDLVLVLTQQVVGALVRRTPSGGIFYVDEIQDQVELALIRSREHDVARAYVLNRERRNQERALQRKSAAAPPNQMLRVVEGGERMPIDCAALSALVEKDSAYGHLTARLLLIQAGAKSSVRRPDRRTWPAAAPSVFPGSSRLASTSSCSIRD